MSSDGEAARLAILAEVERIERVTGLAHARAMNHFADLYNGTTAHTANDPEGAQLVRAAASSGSHVFTDVRHLDDASDSIAAASQASADDAPALARAAIGKTLRSIATLKGLSIRQAAARLASEIRKGCLSEPQFRPIRAMFDRAGYPGDKAKTVAPHTLREWARLSAEQPPSVPFPG
jgi:hypothetical protein